MPVLNPDILEQIVPQFSIHSTLHDRTNGAEGLRKFMLSGKEPFKAALRYFSHVSSVFIDHSKFIVHVRRFPVEKDCETNQHDFPYTFQFLKPILNVLALSNKGLSIGCRPVSADERRVLATLTREGLKSVDFIYGTLPPDYINFFKNECTFEKLYICLCDFTIPTLSDIFTMKSSEHSFQTHFQNINDELCRIPDNITFPDVQKLVIERGCEYEDSFSFDFTPRNVLSFLTRLCKHLPNLKCLEVSFITSLVYPDFDWGDVYVDMTQFNPEMFHHLPSDLKGSICFWVPEYETSFKEVIEDLGENPGVEVVDNYNPWSGEESKLIKKFEIHDGLNFEFEYAFQKECSVGSDMFSFDEDDEMDDDEEEVEDDDGISMVCDSDREIPDQGDSDV